jgi:hypothetical protein
MGCDIHAHVELKINDKWEHYSEPLIGRNYRLFSKLAGVRSVPEDDSAPIAKDRGIPQDISFITKMDLERWGGDAHSHSWITGKEADDIEEWVREKLKEGFSQPPFGYVFGNGLGRDDVRVVFWFDE